MTYSITRFNGTSLGTVPDGGVDNTTSLTLIGRNYANYGQIMVSDLVYLLENFSSTGGPSNPISGQLWWDSGNNLLKVYTGSSQGYKVVGSCTAQGTAPSTSTAVAGDLWWNTTSAQFYVFDAGSSAWTLVGPAYSKVNGVSGAVWEQLQDSGAGLHDVVSLYLDNVRIAILSKDTWTPNATIQSAGFTSIVKGQNLATGNIINGTANNASYLGSQPAANYWLNNTNNTGTGSLTLQSNAGIILGSLGAFNANVHSTTGSGQMWNATLGANVSLHVTTPYGVIKALTANGADGLVYVAANPTSSLGVATKGYVDSSFVNAALTGIPTAPTAPVNTANSMIATTAFVINNSGLYANIVYQQNSSFSITDTGAGLANLQLDGTSVLTATSSQINLLGLATAVTQSQVYTDTGNAQVATTAYVKTSGQWWGGSAKFVSNAAPNPGVNDIGSNNGDFWFQLAS